MPSNVVSRQTIREAIASLIDTKFSNDWAVHNYKVKKLSGKYRNIVVSSAGSGRTIMGADAEEPDTSFRFRIFVLVRYADDANGWTEQESEDELDFAEKTLTDLFTDEQNNANWERIYLEGISDADLVLDLGGLVYRREILNIRTEIYT